MVVMMMVMVVLRVLFFWIHSTYLPEISQIIPLVTIRKLALQQKQISNVLKHLKRALLD